jgi:FixJ family two-component response regulator
METEPVVVILDDDSLSGIMLEFVLGVDGLTTKRFSVPEEFLDYMKTHQPVCIILDMKMPGMSGIDVQCRLREMGCAAPVIYVSGEADVATASAALNNGASCFLPKPFNPHEVLCRIRGVAKA